MGWVAGTAAFSLLAGEDQGRAEPSPAVFQHLCPHPYSPPPRVGCGGPGSPGHLLEETCCKGHCVQGQRTCRWEVGRGGPGARRPAGFLLLFIKC